MAYFKDKSDQMQEKKLVVFMDICPHDNAQFPFHNQFWLISDYAGGQPLTSKKINNFSRQIFQDSIAKIIGIFFFLS